MRAIKATLQKQGDECTRVQRKTRIVIWPLRSHKPLLLKRPIRGGLSGQQFAKAQFRLLALTKVKPKAIHIRTNPKTSTGIRPWKMNSPGSEWLRELKLAARLLARKSFKMETTRWVSKFYNCSHMEIPKLFKVMIVFLTLNLQDGRKCCINPCHKQKRIKWGVRGSCAFSCYLHIEGDSIRN